MAESITHKDLLGLARRTDRKEYPESICFEVNRDRLYPAMLRYMQERVAAFPTWKLTDPSIALYYTKARALPPEAFRLALEANGPNGLDEQQRVARGMALECAREWFTELLHLEAKLKPMVLRLESGKDRWRL